MMKVNLQFHRFKSNSCLCNFKFLRRGFTLATLFICNWHSSGGYKHIYPDISTEVQVHLVTKSCTGFTFLIFCGRRKHINTCVHVQICILVKRVLLGYWLRYLHIWVALSLDLSKTAQFGVFSSSGVLSLTLMFWKICQVLGRILELIYSCLKNLSGVLSLTHVLKNHFSGWYL